MSDTKETIQAARGSFADVGRGRPFRKGIGRVRETRRQVRWGSSDRRRCRASSEWTVARSLPKFKGQEQTEQRAGSGLQNEARLGTMMK